MGEVGSSGAHVAAWRPKKLAHRGYCVPLVWNKCGPWMVAVGPYGMLVAPMCPSEERVCRVACRMCTEDGTLADWTHLDLGHVRIKLRSRGLELRARTQSNPIARWHICQGSINSISFSADGSFLATVGRDDGTSENVMYRFGSVGQDTQLLLWDLVMDEIVVPLRRCPPGGSPTFSSGSQSSHWDSLSPVGTLQSAPSMRDVPKLSPVVAHRVHAEPLSGLLFTSDSVITVCREGHLKIWMRPGNGDSLPVNQEATSSLKG
ncbi:UBP9-binding protein [Nymphaea thermarum]|nr:UBP9-binding protein [Nymphaea thermarum]